MTKPKVLFFDQTARMGGAEKVLLDFLINHDMSKFEAVLVSPSGPLSEAAVRLGIKHIEMPEFQSLETTRSNLNVSELMSVHRLFKKVDRVIAENQPDILVSNSVKAHIAINYKKRNVPTFVRLHDYYSSFGGFSRKLLHRALKNAMSISCVSHSVAQDLIAHSEVNKNQISYCHNGIDLEEHSLHEHHYKPRIIIAGWLLEWKGFDVFVEAMERIADQAKDWEFVIAGDVAEDSVGSEAYAKSLRSKVNSSKFKDRFIFHGRYRSLRELVCCSEHCIFIQPSLRPDPLPTVLLEASAMKLPIIASSLGGSKEIIQDGVSGYLVEPSVDQISTKVLDLILQPQRRHDFGEYANRNMREEFAMDKYASNLSKSILEPISNKKIAIVHDYLNQMGGAERVVAVFHRMFPDAPIYTTIVDRDNLLPELQSADIKATWMQRIPGILERFKMFFWLYPVAVRNINLSEYDIILSSSSAYAKSVKLKNKKTQHICYCHTPMRFAWDFNTYIREMKIPKVFKAITRLFIYPLKWWDKITQKEVSLFVANSTVVKERIKKYYNREALVIFPPVDISRFEVIEQEPEDYYLVVSRLVSYKRIDLAIKACNALGKRLIIIGDGQDRERLESMASDKVEFLGRLPDSEVTRYMQLCKALIFPGIEDFGITPLEANACGRPVIAFRGGGALNTIQEGKNGMFFDHQEGESLANAIRQFEEISWNRHVIREHAEMFSEERFVENIQSLVQKAM